MTAPGTKIFEVWLRCQHSRPTSPWSWSITWASRYSDLLEVIGHLSIRYRSCVHAILKILSEVWQWYQSSHQNYIFLMSERKHLLQEPSLRSGSIFFPALNSANESTKFIFLLRFLLFYFWIREQILQSVLLFFCSRDEHFITDGYLSVIRFPVFSFSLNRPE